MPLIFDRIPISKDYILDINALSTGQYTLIGELGETLWLDLCERLDITPYGGAQIKLEIAKSTGSVNITGHIEARVEQVCARTLEPFENIVDTTFNETLFLDRNLVRPGDMILAGGLLDVKEYIMQHIMLAIDPYPIHPHCANMPRGSYMFSSSGNSNVNSQNQLYQQLKDLHFSKESVN